MQASWDPLTRVVAPDSPHVPGQMRVMRQASLVQVNGQWLDPTCPQCSRKQNQVINQS